MKWSFMFVSLYFLITNCFIFWNFSEKSSPGTRSKFFFLIEITRKESARVGELKQQFSPE